MPPNGPPDKGDALQGQDFLKDCAQERLICLHVVRKALHVVRKALHVVRKALHVVRKALHVVRKALHVV
ncbi:MAG TPA: hypothetical protein VMI75_34705, partial [Polyangiaceae bacterium]|nr:hypothetical protein [Polyangiaceae bacterium]